MSEQQAPYVVGKRRTVNQQSPRQFMDEFLATRDMTLKEARRFLLHAIETMEDLEDTDQ